MEIKDLKNKKILVLGLGKEGRSALQFLLTTFPEKKIGIADKLNQNKLDKELKNIINKNKKRIELNLGKNYLSSLSNYEVIISSPGIPPHKIEDKISDNTIVTSGTKLFLENCPGEVIGVTGTKGKSTTASLIHRILSNNGVKSHLVGNIGIPALSLLKRAEKGDIFVYELSSQQLYQTQKSPHIAVFLNIYPEHLNWHECFENYLQSKSNITKYQNKNDFLIFNPKIEEIKKLSKETKAKKIQIKEEKNNIIWEAFKESSFPADFYFLNVSAATEVAKIYNIPEDKIAREVKNFNPLEHRLEPVGPYKGITFYNDSLATNPNAVIAALNSLGGKVHTLIAGGYERGGIDFTDLALKIVEKKIKVLILFPTTGEKIWEKIPKEEKGNIKKFKVENMKSAVQLAYNNTPSGYICLLSCGSASFGVFKNYKERGNLFKKYVKEKGEND